MHTGRLFIARKGGCIDVQNRDPSTNTHCDAHRQLQSLNGRFRQIHGNQNSGEQHGFTKPHMPDRDDLRIDVRQRFDIGIGPRAASGGTLQPW